LRLQKVKESSYLAILLILRS